MPNTLKTSPAMRRLTERMVEPTELFTDAKGIAQIIHGSKRYVEKLTENGTLPCLRMGSRFTRYNIAECLEILERFKVRAASLGKGRV